MVYTSDIIGKKVISLYESDFVGTISNIHLNKKKNKIALFELISPNEEKLYFEFSNVYFIGESVSIKNTYALLRNEEIDFSTLCPQIINKDIYNEQGSYIGKIIDCVLNEKYLPQNVIVSKSNTNIDEEYKKLINQNLENSTTEFYYTKENQQKNNDAIISTLSIKKLSRIGNVILATTTPNFKFGNLKPKIIINNNLTNYKVSILQSNKSAPVETTNDAELLNNRNDKNINLNNNQQHTLNTSPKNILPTPIPASNSYFLLGRKVIKNIFANNNEIIIRKNSRISNNHIETATLYNKLRELTIYSK